MGKNLKYGEFTFGEEKAMPAAKGYQKGGPKKAAKAMKREPDAMVRKEVALLKKAGAPKAIIEHEVRESKSPIAMQKGGKCVAMKDGGQYAAGATEKMRKEGDVLDELSKKYGTMSQKYEKGGSVAKKLEKHANMPAGKAHGPGGAAKLQKGGVPVHSRVPKIGRMK
jgi:hypothetical protein